MRLRSAEQPLFLAATLNLLMALLVENYWNTLFLPWNVIFDVFGFIISTTSKFEELWSPARQQIWP